LLDISESSSSDDYDEVEEEEEEEEGYDASQKLRSLIEDIVKPLEFINNTIDISAANILETVSILAAVFKESGLYPLTSRAQGWNFLLNRLNDQCTVVLHQNTSIKTLEEIAYLEACDEKVTTLIIDVANTRLTKPTRRAWSRLFYWKNLRTLKFTGANVSLHSFFSEIPPEKTPITKIDINQNNIRKCCLENRYQCEWDADWWWVRFAGCTVDHTYLSFLDFASNCSLSALLYSELVFFTGEINPELESGFNPDWILTNPLLMKYLSTIKSSDIYQILGCKYVLNCDYVPRKVII
jgi:hypothetical protein